MKTDAAHQSPWAIAEVVFGIPFLIGVALHFVAPLTWPTGIARPLVIGVGIVLLLSGIGLIVLARRALARFQQPTDPGRATSQLVTSGVFAFSRNPLYLAAVLVLLGLALAFNLLWAGIMLLPAAVLCHYMLIAPEERYLAAKFGTDYRDYRATVRRWLGRK
ncbi:MAG: isoprenylcysteine carboxylmethyltransferase family protein [Caldilineaceae bacterium]|nr:isoprenylcysteine carboxylmethyltransferase family protein [Caldilineaceae bacterium]